MIVHARENARGHAPDAAQHGDWKAAQRAFAALPNEGLTQLMSPLLIAWAQAGQSDTDGALATLQPKLTGQLAGLYGLHAAMIADLGNRFPQAQGLYSAAAGSYGAMNLRLARILANWEYRQGHVDDATTTLQALGASNPQLGIVVDRLVADVKTRPIRSAVDGLAEVYLSFAAELREQKGAESASVLLRLALDLRPDLTAARMLMADTLDADKQPDDAVRVLTTVGNPDPLAPLVRLRRAQLESEMGDNATALAGLQQLAAAMPTRPEPLAALADLQRIQQHLPAAISTYDLAIARLPPGATDGWQLFFARAIAEQAADQWPKAETDLQHALTLAPDEPAILNFLGYAWADRNEHLSQARTMLDRAASLRPNDGAIVDSLGWVMLRQGDIPGAVKSLEKAVQIAPEDAEINGHLGDAYWAAGLKLQARYQWQLALNLKPDAAAIPKLQAKLQDAVRATDTR